jgi:hypothetical protein
MLHVLARVCERAGSKGSVIEEMSGFSFLSSDFHVKT